MSSDCTASSTRSSPRTTEEKPFPAQNSEPSQMSSSIEARRHRHFVYQEASRRLNCTTSRANQAGGGLPSRKQAIGGERERRAPLLFWNLGKYFTERDRKLSLWGRGTRTRLTLLTKAAGCVDGNKEGRSFTAWRTSTRVCLHRLLRLRGGPRWGAGVQRGVCLTFSFRCRTLAAVPGTEKWK